MAERAPHCRSLTSLSADLPPINQCGAECGQVIWTGLGNSADSINNALRSIAVSDLLRPRVRQSTSRQGRREKPE